jgi:hypothetical protein
MIGLDTAHSDGIAESIMSFRRVRKAATGRKTDARESENRGAWSVITGTEVYATGGNLALHLSAHVF